MNTDPLLPTAALPLTLTKEDRTWGMVVHLSAFAGHIFPFAHIIAPLIIWQVKKDSSAFVDDQGKEAVNAQISLTLYLIGAGILFFVVIGVPLFFGLLLANIVLLVIAAIAANEGKAYRYPFILRLIK